MADLVPTATEAEARAAVEAGDVDAAIVIPAGFTAAVQAGRAGPSCSSSAARRRLPAEIARSVLVGFGSEVTAVQVAVGTASPRRRAPCRTRPSPAELAAAAVAAPAPIVVSTGETADRVASSTTFYGASMAVLFVFFAAQFGVLGLLAERRNGTLARMLAAPDRPGHDPARQGARQPGRGVDLDGRDRRRHHRSCWAPTGATRSRSRPSSSPPRWPRTGIATLIVGFARTEEQASSFIAVVALTLAVFGGSFFRMSQAPEGMAALSIITPHAWFLRGVNDLAAGGGVARRRCRRSLVLAAIGLVTGRHRAAAGAAGGGAVNALLIAAVNVRRLLRDRTSLFFVFVLPIVLIVVLGTMYGGRTAPRMGIVAADSGAARRRARGRHPQRRGRAGAQGAGHGRRAPARGSRRARSRSG